MGRLGLVPGVPLLDPKALYQPLHDQRLDALYRRRVASHLPPDGVDETVEPDLPSVGAEIGPARPLLGPFDKVISGGHHRGERTVGRVDAALDPAGDEITAGTPTSPSYREGVSVWVWDDAGRFGFPRIGIEAVGRTWTTSLGTAFCMATPDDRLLLVSEDHPPLPVADAAGRPRVLAAGPLRFQCVEPFRHWRVDFDGLVATLDVRTHLRGGVAKVGLHDGHDVQPVGLRLEAHAETPPWFQGSHEPEGHFVAGEHRFEQLCAVTGEVEVAGTVTPFTGGALRVHRKGGDRNDYGNFRGHNWQSARFPSGRAFGFIHYRPQSDGTPTYREGWLLDGGEVVPAHVEGTPWMTDTRSSGEDVSFRLRTAAGEIRIDGETFVSSLRPPRPVGDGTSFPLLQSGIARYRWDGEEAYGMVERSARLGEA